MAFYGNGLLSGSSNRFSEHLEPNQLMIPHETEYTLIIDSGNRDMTFFPNPSRYRLTFPESYKNVISLELKGSVFPKSENNVNSSNCIIPFNVQDYITGVNIKSRGYGYTNGVYTVNVSPPAISGGITAVLSITVSNNVISSVSITNRGSGYLRGNYGNKNDNANGFYTKSGAYVILNIPMIANSTQAVLEIEIGNVLIAKLNHGQYDFTVPNDSSPGLCREITRSLQEAIDTAVNNNVLSVPEYPGGPTSGPGYFPYASGLGNQGSCMLTTLNVNATPNNRVAIQRGKNGGQQSLFLELLWNSSLETLNSSRKLLGYGSDIYFSPIDQTSGKLSALVANNAWVSSPIISRNDYDIINTNEFFVLEMQSSFDLDRIESNNNQIEKAFATIIFDSNHSNVVWRETPSSLQPPGTGQSNYASLLSKPCYNRPIKGYDFDMKRIEFVQPTAELKTLELFFKKPNGEYYNFQGRDHLLIFSIRCKGAM
jgi:hypothetical protein